MAKKKRPDSISQWSSDADRITKLAIGASADGLRSTPEDVLEMLFIFGKYDEEERDGLIQFIACEIYPFSDQGESAINLFIKRAKRKGGVG